MKSWIPVAALAAISSGVLPPTSASAQTTATATTSPEALALGQSIVAIILPPSTRQATMDKLMRTMVDQMKAGIPVDGITDPGLRRILDGYLADIPNIVRPTTSAFLPKQMDAMAQAYARMFSLAELKDIAAFANTPSGKSFLQRGPEVMSDPAVAAVNTEYFSQIQAINARTVPELKRKIEAYLKAHPDAAGNKASGGAPAATQQ